MYEFLDRFINVAIPRIKDFRGVSLKGYDNSNNYNLGIKEHTIFPEMDSDKIEGVIGMNITFNLDAKTREEAHELLKMFNMPFRK